MAHNVAEFIKHSTMSVHRAMNDILAIMSRADDTVAQTRLVMIPVLEAKQLLDLADTIVGDPDTAIELELGNEYLPTVQVIVFPHSTVRQLIATACAQASSPPHSMLFLNSYKLLCSAAQFLHSCEILICSSLNQI